MESTNAKRIFPCIPQQQPSKAYRIWDRHNTRMSRLTCFQQKDYSTMNLKALPKVELHKHLEGAVRLSTLCEISGMSEQEVRSLYIVDKPAKDLGAVLDSLVAAKKHFNTYEIIERISFEAVEDAFFENTKILELRYAPNFLEDGMPQLEIQKIHDAIKNGIERAQSKYDILVGLIGIIVRAYSLETAESCMDFFIKNKKDFIGVDLADNEADFSPSLFKGIFSRAKEAGFKITIHAGEINSPESPQNIIDAINILGAERIGHGLQCIKDEEVMKEIKKKNIHLELCPISNWITNAIPDKESHPFVEIQDYGISCSINSDDPGLFGSSLMEDFAFCADTLGMTEDKIKQSMRDAFKASFVPNKQRFSGLFL